MGLLRVVLVLLILVANVEATEEIWPLSPQDCLAATIYHEARGEPLVGQYMVAQVVLNRLHSSRFPDKICEVIKQSKQFSWFNPIVAKYPNDRHAWEVAKSITSKFLLGDVRFDITEGALYYHASYMTAWWAKNKTFIVEVSGHKFYR